MDQTLLEIPAVILILSFVALVLVRAFASQRGDGIDIFMKRDTAARGETSGPTARR